MWRGAWVYMSHACIPFPSAHPSVLHACLQLRPSLLCPACVQTPTEVKQQLLDLIEIAFQRAGLLDASPQQQGGLAAMEAVLSAKSGAVNAAGTLRWCSLPAWQWLPVAAVVPSRCNHSAAALGTYPAWRLVAPRPGSWTVARCSTRLPLLHPHLKPPS